MGIYCSKDCDHKYEKCHGSCQEYLNQKAEHDRQKAERDMTRRIVQDIYAQRDLRVYKAKRHRMKGKRGEQ